MTTTNLPKRVKYTLLALIVAVSAASGFFYRGIPTVSEASATTSAAKPDQEPHNITTVSLPDFAEIARLQGPAVVNISVSGSVKTGFSG